MCKQLLLGFGLLFLSTYVSAQCLQGNCQNGHGTFVFKSGAKYMGDFKNGIIDGQGILYFSNGDKYIGQWKKHYREGKGKLIFANGDTFQGHFEKSEFKEGVMTYSNGDRYEGQWHKNEPEGSGTYTFKNGNLYEGTFVDGRMHGEGSMEYANGSVHIGSWQNGECTTDDTPAVAEEDISEKNLPNCNKTYCPEGRGVFRYPDGSKYVGDFKDGQPDGMGQCYYANGDEYKGYFRNHAPNGEGIYTYVNGKVTAAMWKQGTPMRRLATIYADTSEEVIETKEVKIWSVVVGISTYDHMPALRFTDDDAYRFYAFLRSPEGGALQDEQIKILVDEDATRDNIIGALRSTFLKADKNDVIVFYYSGHGLEGSLIPVDYDGFNNRLMNEEIKQIFDESIAKHKVIFSDACYSGSLSGDLLAMKSPVNRMMNKYYKSFEDTKGGLAFLTSSKSEEVSLEDGGLRQGVYTHFLIRGLNGEADTNQNKIVSVSELFDFVRDGVRAYTGNVQTPVIAGNFDPNMPVAAIR